MTNNLCYVSLTASGVPVSVSTGIPLMTRKGISEGVGIQLRTPYSGGAELSIAGPTLGPDRPSWQSMTVIPHHPSDPGQLRPLEDRSWDFTWLTSVEPYWVADTLDGSHVLMDAATRRLVRVSRLDPALRGRFWSALADALNGVETAEEFAQPMILKWSKAGLYDRGVWLCLHPAPYDPKAPINWNFDGQRHVCFDWTGSRAAESDAMLEEDLCGAHDYA